MLEKPKKILVVEDEEKIQEVVVAYLEKAGFHTKSALDGELAYELFKQENFDLVILDLNLPKIDGLTLCKMMKAKTNLPIIMLTARASEDNIIEGLELGADDYITKPFSTRELVARVQSIFRRLLATPKQDFLSFNQKDLVIDYGLGKVYKKETEVLLTPYEYKIIKILSLSPTRAYSREDIIEAAFGMDFQGYDRTIDSHIKNIRSKIEDDSQNPKYIITKRGLGYYFGGERD